MLVLSLSVFVVSEYILSTDNVYPAYIAMSTGAVGLIMFWRYNYIVCTLKIYSLLWENGPIIILGRDSSLVNFFYQLHIVWPTSTVVMGHKHAITPAVVHTTCYILHTKSPKLTFSHSYLFFVSRLHQVGQLPLNSCLLNICLHLTKLSLLLPSPPPPSHSLTTTLLTTVAIFLISYVVLREMLFEQSFSSSQVWYAFYCCYK